MALGLTGAALLLALSRTPAQAATINVVNGQVAINDNNQCSLIEAIQNANDAATGLVHDDCAAGDPAGLDTINLPANGTFTLTTPFAYLYHSDTGLPALSSTIIIEGNGSTITRGRRAAPFRLLAVTQTGDVELRKLTLSQGYSKPRESGVFANGGAIYNNGGRLRLTDSTLRQNNAYGDGGALHNQSGQLILDQAFFEQNAAYDDGGGLYNNGTVTMDGSVFLDNSAVSRGGGLFNDNGVMGLRNSNVNGNQADSGGGLYNDSGKVTVSDDSLLFGNAAFHGGGGGLTSRAGELTISGSLLSENTSGRDGGGVLNVEGTLTITASTLDGNSADLDGGGVHSQGDTSIVTIDDSLLSGNTASAAGGGVYNEGGTLTITDSTFSGNTAESAIFNGGGGVCSRDGALTITDSTFSGNTAVYSDGGVFSVRNIVNITGSTFSGNTAGRWGGGVRHYTTQMTIANSTISGNTASSRGGGIGSSGHVTITNSTISDNTGTNGGGIDIYGGSLTMTNSTISGNTALNEGGGMYLYASKDDNITINRSLVSGNWAWGVGDEVSKHRLSTIIADNYNLFGHSGISNADAFDLFTPGPTDITATSDGTDPTPLSAILNTTLQNNGGPTNTHALLPGSPALDAASSADCQAGTPANGLDQRGEPRNVDGDGSPSANECDIGAFEGAVEPQPFRVFLSTVRAGSVGDFSFGTADVLRYDGQGWSLFFDGRQFGLNTQQDIDAFHVPGEDGNALYLSFRNRQTTLPGVGVVDSQDVVFFDGMTFHPYFDGSDVGLTTAGENLDALHILPGPLSPIGDDCAAYLLLSTTGNGRVTDADGHTLSFRGEDILGFCLTRAGTDTAGLWHLLLDGSAAGLPRNATVSLSSNEDGTLLYLTTNGRFNAGGLTGDHSTVYTFDTRTGTFGGPIFAAADAGLMEQIDGLEISRGGATG